MVKEVEGRIPLPMEKKKPERVGWTRTEDAIITQSVEELGHRWYHIAERLPGRTDHAIRNRWHRLQSMRHVSLPESTAAGPARGFPAFSQSPAPLTHSAWTRMPRSRGPDALSPSMLSRPPPMPEWPSLSWQDAEQAGLKGGGEDQAAAPHVAPTADPLPIAPPQGYHAQMLNVAPASGQPTVLPVAVPYSHDHLSHSEQGALIADCLEALPAGLALPTALPSVAMPQERGLHFGLAQHP